MTAGNQPSSSEISDLRRDVIELRDWKEAVLDKCKASDGFEAMPWGGDKEGWGFVHYFIGHLETRALHAETVLAEQDAFPVAQAAPKPDGYNGCYREAIAALNYLASHTRPSGGQERFNAEHLLQIADEMKRSRPASPVPSTTCGGGA